MSEQPEQVGPTQPTTPSDRLPTFGPVISGVLSVFLASSIVLIAPVGFIVAPLALIPVLRYSSGGRSSILVWGPVVGFLALLSISGVGFLALAVLVAYLAIVVLPTVSVEAWQRFGWSEGRWAAVTTLVLCVLLVGVGTVISLPDGPVKALMEWVTNAAQDAEELYISMGLGRGEVQLAMDRAQAVLAWTLPSLVTMYVVAILFWIRPRLPVLGFQVPAGPFESYRSDEWLPAVFASAGLGTVLASGTVRWVALNILLTVLALYFIHGLAIIRAHLARWIGRGWLVRWGVGLLALQMPLPAVVALLGLVDAFRPLRPQPNEDGGQQ